MKMQFTILCLLAISTTFADTIKQGEAHFITDEGSFFLQQDLVRCAESSLVNQPVYLHSEGQEKAASSGTITLLNLDPPSAMSIEAVAECILYGEADVVYLRNTPTPTAYPLYELLQQHYAHFLYVPHPEKGIFVASKYPLKHAVVTRAIQKDTSYEDVLHFSLDGLRAYIYPGALSMQMTPSSATTETPVLLLDMPAILTAVKQSKPSYSPLPLSENIEGITVKTLEILVRRGDDRDNRGDSYVGFKGTATLGGEDGPKLEVSVFGGHEDGKGNYVEAEVKTEGNGKGSASVEGGHDKNKDR